MGTMGTPMRKLAVTMIAPSRPALWLATTAEKVPIQSVVRAFSVLEALAGNPAGLRLAEISRMVDLHKATAFRLVRTLVVLGYVTQSAEGERYRIRKQAGRNLPTSDRSSGPRNLRAEAVFSDGA